jgi:hypothetical protein
MWRHQHILMTALQKSLIIVTMAAVGGTSIYEVYQASTLHVQVHTLRQQQASFSDEILQVQRDRDEAVRLKGNIPGILADKNFRTVLHALEQRNGIETLGEPEVTTTSGRGIQGQFVNVVFPVFTNPSPSSNQRGTE